MMYDFLKSNIDTSESPILLGETNKYPSVKIEKGEEVTLNQPMSPFEEADFRISFHLYQSLRSRLREHSIIFSNDTDVAVALLHHTGIVLGMV